MESAGARGWKFYLGMVLFVYSLATLGIAALVPFLFAPAVAATAATGVIVSGEVGFWVSAALLGKPFVEALKAKIKGLFRGAAWPAQPVSRRRHVVGLVLFSLSFVTYYVIMVIPFLGLTKEAELAVIIVVAIFGELLFFTSLLVLGGEFWERIKALYSWPGEPPTHAEKGVVEN